MAKGRPGHRARRRGPTLIQRSRNIPAEQKAIWHQVSGAGTSRVRREFFDLNARDMEAITAFADRRIGQRLAETR